MLLTFLILGGILGAGCVIFEVVVKYLNLQRAKDIVMEKINELRLKGVNEKIAKAITEVNGNSYNIGLRNSSNKIISKIEINAESVSSDFRNGINILRL